MTVDGVFKEEAAQILTKGVEQNSSDEKALEGEPRDRKVDHLMAIVGVIILLFCVLAGVAMIMMIRDVSDFNGKFENLSQWIYYCSLLKAQSTEIFLSLLHAIFLVPTGRRTITCVEIDTEVARTQKLIERMSEGLSYFLEGKDEVPAILGENEHMDVMLTQPSCIILQENSSDWHQLYQCAAISNQSD